MVATLSIFKDTVGTNGSPGTSTDIGPLGPPSLRLKTADNVTIDSTNPVPIPASGTNYSFASSLYVKVLIAPNTQINNFKIYTDAGAFGNGITTYIGDQYPTRNSGSTAGYIVATGTTGTTGTEMIAFYTGITTKTNIFTFTSGSPATGPSISEAGNILTSIGHTTNYFVVQANVGSTATPGTKPQSVWSTQWDEI
jgi:hypothetical protein